MKSDLEEAREVARLLFKVNIVLPLPKQVRELMNEARELYPWLDGEESVIPRIIRGYTERNRNEK